MCCLFSTLVILGPRAAIFLWWLFDPARWNLAFNNLLWPILGFIFLPWTTLMWVVVAADPGGGHGLDVVFLIIAIFIDFAAWGGGAYSNKNKIGFAD